MKHLTCGKCDETQWSIGDNKYLELFGNCWSCDRKRWEDKRMTLQEFERREKVSSQSCGLC